MADLDLEELLRPRPDPAAVPPPLDEIAGRARRRSRVRRGAVTSLAAVVVVTAAWAVTRAPGSDGPSTVIDPAVTGEPSEPSEPTTASPTTASTTRASTTSTTANTTTTTAASTTTNRPSPAVEPELSATIEDGDIGTSDATVQYTGGTWTHCGGCNVATPDASYRYAYQAGDAFTVRFTGVRLVLHAPDDRAGGTATVTVDGQPAATPTIAYRTSDDPADGVRWDSGVLAAGTHTVVVTAQDGPGDDVILFDRAGVYT